MSALIFSIGCSANQASGNVIRNNPVKIGVIMPLTGEVSQVGLAIKAGVEMASQEINQQGGINGRPVEIIYEDGRCTAKDSLNAANKIINIDHVKYLLTECSPGTLAIAPLAEKNKVILIAYVSSSPDVTNAGDYIFRVYKYDRDAGKAAAQYIYDEGFRQIGVLSSLNDYSESLAVVFSEAFTEIGGSIVFKESYEPGTKDLRSNILKLKNSNAHAVFLTDFTDGVITYFQQAKEIGFELPVYGADNFDDPKIYSTIGSLFNGAKYVEIKQAASSTFKEKIMKTTKQESVPIGVTNAYDALHILTIAIREAGDDTTAVKNYLYNMPPYKGESGNIKFDEYGDVTGYSFELRKIQNGTAVAIR